MSVALFFWFSGQKPLPEYTTVSAARGSLIQTVSETGTVKPVKRLELNFPQSGKISTVSVKVGDRVSKDQVLAELDQSALLIRLQEAQASLLAAQAGKNKLISGATLSERAVLEAQVRQAKAAYDGAVSDYDKTRKTAAENIAQAEKRLADLNDESALTPTALEQGVAIAKLNLESGTANYWQALENAENVFINAAAYNIVLANAALDKVWGVLEDDDLEGVFSVKNTSYKALSKQYYEESGDLRSKAQAALESAKSLGTENSFNELHSALNAYLNKVFTNLSAVFSGLENSVTSSSFSQAEFDAYKTSISGQISSINSGISSQVSAKNSLDSAFLSYKNNTASLSQALRQAEINLAEGRLAAENSLASSRLAADKQIAASKSAMESAKENWGVADRQLAKLNAGARSEDLSLADAQINQAQANLDLLVKQQEDSRLKAPIDGQIVAVNYEAGEQFVSAKPVLAMLTEDNFEIEVDISETEISKVKVGDEATVTFDALGEEREFSGLVYSIEPSATVIQGVIYYKAKITLSAQGPDGQDISLLIRPEMTANVVILTDRKDNVMIIPIRAVVDRGDQVQVVRILEGEALREVPVSLGLRGDDGLVEVVSGNLSVGEQVVTFIKEPGK